MRWNRLYGITIAKVTLELRRQSIFLHFYLQYSKIYQVTVVVTVEVTNENHV